ncbi:hypothetical protein L9F63_004868, partial [Diploptera punctata]
MFNFFVSLLMNVDMPLTKLLSQRIVLRPHLLRLMCNCRAMARESAQNMAVLDLPLVYPRSLFHIPYSCTTRTSFSIHQQHVRHLTPHTYSPKFCLPSSFNGEDFKYRMGMLYNILELEVCSLWLWIHNVLTAILTNYPSVILQLWIHNVLTAILTNYNTAQLQYRPITLQLYYSYGYTIPSVILQLWIHNVLTAILTNYYIT